MGFEPAIECELQQIVRYSAACETSTSLSHGASRRFNKIIISKNYLKRPNEYSNLLQQFFITFP